MSDLIDRQALLNEYDKAHVGPPGKARKLIEDVPTASPWHRVEEPPKVGQNVLTMDSNEDMETATYDGEGFEDSYGFYVADVLYWMPIEPPKEENK